MIRVATVADAPGIARVNVTTWRGAYAGLVPDHVLTALSVPATASRWEGHLAYPEGRTWVAEAGDVVGYASAGPSRDADLAAYGELYALYVLPAEQRAGLGRALLSEATAWLREQAFEGAILWVLTHNGAARACYAACGWAPDGAARGIDVGGAVVDEVRYRLMCW